MTEVYQRKMDERTWELVGKIRTDCAGEKITTIVGALSVFFAQLMYDISTEEQAPSAKQVAEESADQFKAWVVHALEHQTWKKSGTMN